MIRKPSPIHSFFKGFKILSIMFGSAFAALMIIAGLAFSSITLCVLGAGIYVFGHNIWGTIAEEERKEKFFSDED